MNNPSPTDPLDSLLQEWHATQMPPASDLDELASRITDSLAPNPTRQRGGSPSESSLTLPVEMSSDSTSMSGGSNQRQRSTRWQSTVWFTLGAAAMAIVAVATMLLRNPAVDQQVVQKTEDLPPQFAWLQSEQLENKAVLLHEMEAVFDDQLAWLAEDGGQVQIGVADQQQENGQPVVVRLVVQRRAVGDSEWNMHWAMDVLARSEQVVRVAPKTTNGAGLELWAYRLPDGEISVDTDLVIDGHQMLAMTHLHADSTPQSISGGDRDGFEYRVFQTAAALPSNNDSRT